MAGRDPLFSITFALGKLVHTLPSAWRGSFGEGCPTTAAGVETVICLCGAQLCDNSQSPRELGVPRQQALLSQHASTVTGVVVAVPEGSPLRLLCNAGPICDVVAAVSVHGTGR
jgi:hypothetical protein